MHDAAFAYVARTVAETGPFARVVEFGARNINGTVRGLFSGSDYVGVDIAPGAGVDVVCDAAEWQGDGFDAVVCCEMLEHTPAGASVVAAARRSLVPGGVLILTCATDPRAPHNATDGGPITGPEHYANVSRDTLAGWLDAGGFAFRTLTGLPGDLYCLAVA